MYIYMDHNQVAMQPLKPFMGSADQDIVARGAKFWVLYKRGGHRVLINKMGDLVVRPNPMEASMSLITCFGSVQHHLLTTYLQSLLAVLLCQFSSKQMKGGLQGVVQLVEESLPLQVRAFPPWPRQLPYPLLLSC